MPGGAGSPSCSARSLFFSAPAASPFSRGNRWRRSRRRSNYGPRLRPCARPDCRRCGLMAATCTWGRTYGSSNCPTPCGWKRSRMRSRRASGWGSMRRICGGTQRRRLCCDRPASLPPASTAGGAASRFFSIDAISLPPSEIIGFLATAFPWRPGEHGVPGTTIHWMREETMRYSGAVFLIALGFCGSGHAQPAGPVTAEVEQAFAAVRPQAIRAHMGFLADDLLEGRRTGTRGYDVAAHYVAAQLEALGLEPAGTGGGYFQPVPLVQITTDEPACSLAFLRDGRTTELRYGSDYFTGIQDTTLTAPVV